MNDVGERRSDGQDDDHHDDDRHDDMTRVNEGTVYI